MRLCGGLGSIREEFYAMDAYHSSSTDGRPLASRTPVLTAVPFNEAIISAGRESTVAYSHARYIALKYSSGTLSYLQYQFTLCNV